MGWLFKLHEGSRNALSLNVSMVRQQGAFVNLLDWLSRVLEDDGFRPGNTLVRNRDSLRGTMALSPAHAFGCLLGLTARGGHGVGEQLDLQGENEITYLLAAGSSINFDATTRVPFGVYLGAKITDLAEGRNIDDELLSVNLGINYMGFEDFVIGMQGSDSSIPLTGYSRNLTATLLSFHLLYYY